MCLSDRSERQDFGDFPQKSFLMIRRKGHRRAGSAADHLHFRPVRRNSPHPNRHAIAKSDLGHAAPGRDEAVDFILIQYAQIVHRRRRCDRFPDWFVSHIIGPSHALALQAGDRCGRRTTGHRQQPGQNNQTERQASFHNIQVKPCAVQQRRNQRLFFLPAHPSGVLSPETDAEKATSKKSFPCRMILGPAPCLS